MTAESYVDAALSGLDLSESATLPSVEDYKLWLNFEGARRGLPTVDRCLIKSTIQAVAAPASAVAT